MKPRRAPPLPLYKSVNIVSLNLAGQTQSPISPCKPGSQHRAAASPASAAPRHLCKPKCKPRKARGRETRMQTPPSLVRRRRLQCPSFIFKFRSSAFFILSRLLFFFLFWSSLAVDLWLPRGIHDWVTGVSVLISTFSVCYFGSSLRDEIIRHEQKMEIPLSNLTLNTSQNNKKRNLGL